jgi:hypothetical protein
MGYVGKIGRSVFVSGVILAGIWGASSATAARLTSPSYQLDSNFNGSFGGATSSTSYKMTSTGGESIVGNGASGSYKITQGSDNIAPFLTVGIPATNVFFGSITSGASQVQDFDVVAESNTPSYNLSIQQDHNLQITDASATIPSVSGTTASPLSWSEGTTTGLGYSVASAPVLQTKWATGTKFAAIPTSAITFYDGTGGAPDTISMRLRLGVSSPISMRLRLGVSSQQKAGDYSNLVTISGTITP